MIWLEQLSRAEFMEKHFQRSPHSETGSAAAAGSLMSWDKVAALLEARPRPDLIVSQKGQWLAGRDPASIDEARTLFESGCSIVLRNVERFDDDMRDLAATFARELAGEVAVHVFATPGHRLGFGWHYDCEDVFIGQVAGAKDYLLRENTVNPRPTIDTMPRDMQVELETTPLIACTLVAGDWLYIPRGWWHKARATDDSLSISVGVLTAAS